MFVTLKGVFYKTFIYYYYKTNNLIQAISLSLILFQLTSKFLFIHIENKKPVTLLIFRSCF